MKARTSMNALLLIFFNNRRVATSTFRFTLFLQLLYPVYIYDQLNYIQQYSPQHYISQYLYESHRFWPIPLHSHICSACLPKLYRESRQTDTLPLSLIHLWYVMSTKEKDLV